MEKTFRGKVTTLQVKPMVERVANKPEDVPWPCIAGPNMPDTDPKLWKKPRLDMNSSLAFLRRELAAMQLQDRAIHKQLIKLNSAILGLKTSLNESWEQDDKSEAESEIEAVCYPTETSSAVTKVEVTVNSRTHVSHAKQDSGILTDEESGDEETDDVFESEQPAKARPPRVRSVSVIDLTSYHSSIDIDINNNKRTQSARSHSNTNSFQDYNLSMPRSRPHTDGHFHRVTSMPVINENPSPDSTTSSQTKGGKAFAIYGYANENNHASNHSTRGFPLNFKPLSRHESMPVISSGYGEQRSIQHHRSHTEPVQFQRGRFNSSFSARATTQTLDRPVMRASSQMDLRTIDQQAVKPYRIYRISSQVSLV